MTRMVEGKWGDARRKLEAALEHAERQQEYWAGCVADVLDNLTALDKAIDALNYLPKGVQDVLQGKKYTPAPRTPGARIINPHTTSQAASTQTTPKTGKPTHHGRNTDNSESARDARVLDALSVDEGYSMKDLAILTDIHYTEVSKGLNRLLRQGLVHYERSSNNNPASPKVWYRFPKDTHVSASSQL